MKIKALRLLMFILSCVLLFFFAGPIILSRIITIGNIFGTAACLYVAARCLFPGWFKRLKEKFFERKPTRFIWRFCQGAIALFSAYAIVVSAAMVYFATIAPAPGATSVALGAKVRKDGSPSRAISDRTKACCKYLNDNPDAKAVLSGGRGSDEGISEAEYMYNALTAYGIDSDRLIIEDRSTSTRENLKNSYALIKKNHLPRDIAITTDSYHQLRARIIAKKQGAGGEIGAVNADSYIWIYPTYFVREWFAIPVELIK